MSLRYRKSIKVAPGVKVNVGKKSVGISAGNKYGGVSVNSKTGTRARVSAPGTGISYSGKIDKNTNIETINPNKKEQNQKLNKVLNKILIILFSLLVVALIVLFGINSYIKHYKDIAFKEYSTELSSVLTELEGVPDFKIKDSYVQILVPSVWYNDSTASQIYYCETIQDVVTSTRNQWENLCDGYYVPIYFCDSHGNQVATASSTGKIEIK